MHSDSLLKCRQIFSETCSRQINTYIPVNVHHWHVQAPSWSVVVLPVFMILSIFPCWVEAKVVRLDICIQVCSQVSRWCSGGRLKSLGSPRIDTLSALVMSSDISILAMCPKDHSCLDWMRWDSCGGEPAGSHTVSSLSWQIYLSISDFQNSLLFNAQRGCSRTFDEIDYLGNNKLRLTSYW